MRVFVGRDRIVPRASDPFPPLAKGGQGGEQSITNTFDRSGGPCPSAGAAARSSRPRNCLPGPGSAGTTPPNFARGEKSAPKSG